MEILKTKYDVNSHAHTEENYEAIGLNQFFKFSVQLGDCKSDKNSLFKCCNNCSNILSLDSLNI